MLHHHNVRFSDTNLVFSFRQNYFTMHFCCICDIKLKHGSKESYFNKAAVRLDIIRSNTNDACGLNMFVCVVLRSWSC